MVMAMGWGALRDLLVQQLSASIQIIKGMIEWMKYVGEAGKSREGGLVGPYGKMLEQMLNSYFKLLFIILNSLEVLLTTYSRVDARLDAVVPRIDEARRLVNDAARDLSMGSMDATARELEAAAEVLLSIQGTILSNTPP
ncbi:hypothetical protein [Thermocladium modestius]|uniref:hypothetical protein n=1 Tax=Thermocladium modestius TaxID=62609 RepID=UPI00166A2EF7|nr:hypothetical protein [Thermocladium modestius]